MHRRRFFASFGVVSLSGCAGFLPIPNRTDGGPEFPGGTLIIENTGDDPLDVSVSVIEDQFSASLSTTVSAGESVVEREFIAASEGDIVTLTAQVGGEGESTTFEFLPNGGDDDTPPEVARLSIEGPVEESATWTATTGTSE